MRRSIAQDEFRLRFGNDMVFINCKGFVDSEERMPSQYFHDGLNCIIGEVSALKRVHKYTAVVSFYADDIMDLHSLINLLLDFDEIRTMFMPMLR